MNPYSFLVAKCCTLNLNLPNNNEWKISNSSFSGAVTGNNTTGGLVGEFISGSSNNNISITDSSASGSVQATGDSVGGLVGQMQTVNGSNTVQNSSASGTVQGRQNVGGLVGRIQVSSGSVIIQNSSASGDVRGTGNNVGGLVGVASSSSVTRSHSTGKVSGNSSVGGLVGKLASSSSVTGSYSTSNVIGNSDYIGGLVGDIPSDSNSSVSNSYAIGSVVGKKNSVGGLVGQINNVTVQNNYAMSQVSGVDSIGGLLGFMASYPGATVSNNYSTSFVKGNNSVGGLVGFNFGNPVQTENSYWNSETSGQPNSAEGTARTSTQMLTGTSSDHFSGFGTAWNFAGASSYPVLTGNIADATLQALHQVAGMMRLANADGDEHLGGTVLPLDITIDSNIANNLGTGNTLFVLDTNLEATNDSNREDFWDCESGSGDIILTTESVNGTNIELRFSSGTTDKTAWQKSSTTGSCAIIRTNTNTVQTGDKINLDAIISKGTGTNKRIHTKKFSITFTN